MTFVPRDTIPVVLSLEAAAPKSQHTINTEADQVITIPITVAADGELGHLSWDDLLGKR